MKSRPSHDRIHSCAALEVVGTVRTGNAERLANGSGVRRRWRLRSTRIVDRRAERLIRVKPTPFEAEEFDVAVRSETRRQGLVQFGQVGMAVSGFTSRPQVTGPARLYDQPLRRTDCLEISGRGCDCASQSFLCSTKKLGETSGQLSRYTGRHRFRFALSPRVNKRVFLRLLIKRLLASRAAEIKGAAAKDGLVLRPANVHHHSADRIFCFLAQ